MNPQARFGLFMALALAQLFFPAKLIYDSLAVLQQGEVLKLATRPIDPVDYFRGYFVTLNFEADQFTETSKKHSWKRNQEIYVLFRKDSLGFARIESLNARKPQGNELYVKAKIDYIRDQQIMLEYPFNRFYMEESKAPKAEDLYRRAEGQGYALVKVRRGKAVLEDVVVKGKSLRDIAGEQ